MEKLSYLSLLPHKGVARRSTVHLFPHWCNGNYGEVCVLRDKPNINWNKDRGKDVESAPWYHLWGGDRINDHHLTLAEKRAAR